MEKVESALDVLSRAATMIQPCPTYPASDSDGFDDSGAAVSALTFVELRVEWPARACVLCACAPRVPAATTYALARESVQEFAGTTALYDHHLTAQYWGECGVHEYIRNAEAACYGFEKNAECRLLCGLQLRTFLETPSTASSGESEGDRTLSPEAPQPKELTGKWRRERRSTRLPDYRPRENGKMALRSQSFNERRSVATVARAQRYSDGELSDETDDAPTNLAINGKAPPEYPGSKNEAPIDMRLRARPAPPPYSRPSVIRSSDTPPGSMSMCDPVIDEHFRRSLGDNYMNLFKKSTENCQPGPKPNTKDRASSPIHFKTEEIPKSTKIIAMEVDDPSVSVDEHFAKALGETWKQIQTSSVVDDHFNKALGETWKKIQSTKPDGKEEKSKDQTKIISRSGVVI